MRLKSEKRQKNRKDGVYFRYLLQGLISDPTGGAIPVNRGCRIRFHLPHMTSLGQLDGGAPSYGVNVLASLGSRV